jgi:integrase
MTTDPYTLNTFPTASDNLIEFHRLKRRYEIHLKRARGLDQKTIEHSLSAAAKLFSFLEDKSLKSFSTLVAMMYVDYALGVKNTRTGKKRALVTVIAELNRIKDFLIWLQSQPGYKSRISYSDIQYLNVNRKELRAARAATRKSQPSIVDCRVTFERMPKGTEVEMRNRALFALLMLTGARIDALVTLQVRHLNMKGEYILQSGLESRTKNSKTFLSGFFNIDKIYKKEIKAWLKYLSKEKQFGAELPLFPKPKIPSTIGFGQWGDTSEDFYKGPGQPSRMISDAFVSAIGERHGPHSIRRTITKWVVEKTQRQDEIKAASLNLGHTDIQTTTSSYLSITEEQQVELVRQIGRKKKK